MRGGVLVMETFRGQLLDLWFGTSDDDAGGNRIPHAARIGILACPRLPFG